MSKKRGLGLGLNELLSIANNNVNNTNEEKYVQKYLPLDVLKPGRYQPRRQMDQEALVQLADSIRKQGIIQPIVVRSVGVSSYEIIAGERRWRAAMLASLHEVPVVVKDLSDEQAIACSLIENIQREDLNAIDTALSLKRLCDEFSMTHENAASVVGKSRAAVSNLLRLLDLPEDIKSMIQCGELEMGHARALLPLDLANQLSLAKMIVARGLSARMAEGLARQLQKPKIITKRSIDSNTTHLEKEISAKLAAPVNIQHLAKTGKGKIVIHYNSLDELDGILKHIN